MVWNIKGRLPPGVAEHLGHYVYMYVDPDTQEPFYIGKGVGERIFAHLSDTRDSARSRKIAELRAKGRQPQLEILAHGLKDDETAFRVEAAVIDALGLGSLTNQVSGWRSLQVGRMSLDDLIEFYAAEPVQIEHPVLIIRINQLFRRGMTDTELYEATRGIWRLGIRRNQVKYAFSVFHGLVREVYEVKSWYPARTLTYETRDLSERDVIGRWEFDGAVAPDHIRLSYLKKSVHQYLARGNKNATVYVNVK